MKKVLPIPKGVLALLLALFLGMGTAYAYDFSVVVSGKTFYFNLIDATHHYVEVTYPGTYSNPYGGFTKPTGNISIPDGFYSGSTLYTVTKIGDRAFYGCSGLTGSLTIPSTVNSIGVDAFYNCSGFSGSLSVPNSVTTIGSWAFSNCGFTGSLTIGNGVTEIGAYAFYQCVSFTGSLTLGSSVTSIGQYAFQNCAGFTGSLTIPSSVTTIGNNAFQNCFGFTGTLTLGSSLTSIGDKAFYNCNKFTGSLTIPSSVTTIGSEAFYYCNGFTGILTIGTGVTSIGASAFKNCTGFTQVKYNAINCANLTSDTKPFEGCTATTLTIGSGVQRIPAYMFYECSNFTGTLTIPNSVTTIGNGAFFECYGFTGSLTIPNSVTTIGVSAFGVCTGITGTLTLGNSVTTISPLAFQGCGFTGTLTIPSSVTALYFYAFQYCQNFTQINYNAVNCADVTSTPFNGCSATTLTIGSGVQRIPAKMFEECSNFTGTLTIPTTVTEIGASAFKNCTGFTQVKFNAINCADVAYNAKPFEDCTATTLTIGSSVQRIPANIFRDCSNFTGTLTIPSSVTEIGNGAFRECTGMTGSLDIPESVTSIGNYAFYNCHSFTGTLTLPNSLSEIGTSVFENCYGFHGFLTLPNSVTMIYDNAFAYCAGFMGSLTIPNSVTYIGSHAFEHCEGMTGMLTIGSSVTEIAGYAFGGCSNFSSMTVYPETPPDLSPWVFQNIPTSIPVYAPCASLEDYQSAYGWSAFTNMQCRETLTVYEGTSTNRNVPAYIYYFDNFTRSQFVIPAEDLVEMIGTPISSMTFYTTSSNVPYTTTCSADVYLKQVDYTTISAYEPKSSATTVYSGTFSIASTENGGEMTINFSTPYTYHGNDLLVGIENTETGGWKEIYFYGQTVSGASISGNTSSSTGTIPANQQNFIPKTTFGFAPTCFAKNLPYTYGFEEEDEMECWTMLDCATYTGRDTYSEHQGEYGFRFCYNTNPPQYLISPKLECPWGVDVSFYYKNASDYYPETFQVGYSTTTKSPSAFIWSDQVTANHQNTWMLYGETFPEGTKYVAVRYNSYDMDRLYIDDFSFEFPSCPRPIDLTATDITTNSAMLQWAGYQDSYDLRYRKKVYFYEDFENGLPSDWTTIDNDGDGYNWHSVNYSSSFCHSGSTIMASASYDNDNSTVLTPDNLLITPQLELQGAMKVWIRALHPNYAQEHFAIYLSTTGNSVSDFTTVLVPETTLTDVVYRAYTADLSAYEGQQGYIAIRHFNCSDMYEILLDDFGLYHDVDETGEWETLYEVGSNYTLTTLEPITEYEWQVRGRDCDGEGTYSEWSSVHNFTTLLCAPEDQCELTFTLTDSYGDGWNGAAILVVDVETDIVLASMANENLDGAYVEETQVLTLAVCDGRELRFEWMSGSYDSECSYTVTDVNGNEVFSGTGAMSEPFNYIVDCPKQYVFLTNGNWNNGSHWNTGSVPPAGSNVIIQADVTVPEGYLAVANAVTLDSGSITVADGGQLKHNTQGLEVTMKKNIEPYTDANDLNYYLLAVPFPLGVEIPAAMTANEGCDLYEFDSDEPNAEWRNHKQTPMSNFYLANGYLYASPEPIEISVTGLTIATGYESVINITLGYTEGSDSPYNGWELLGNPFTYNAYVYRRTSDGELVPMEVMMYDENGDLQTITCGPIAPMQGFFVHLTEETTVSFRGRAHINDYVDLGLPSGTKWATCNVGADSPEDYGDYFAWGETQPKDYYNWSNYQYCNGSQNTMTKYCNNSSYGYNGFTDNLTTLLPEDDAATANWGSGWRMPTKEEWQELYNNTTVTWTTQNGVSGRLFTAANGNSLFLPAAGGRWDDELFGAGDWGGYWSSSLNTDYPYNAWYFYFNSVYYNMYDGYRGNGFTVRPVREN